MDLKQESSKSKRKAKKSLLNIVIGKTHQKNNKNELVTSFSKDELIF